MSTLHVCGRWVRLSLASKQSLPSRPSVPSRLFSSILSRAAVPSTAHSTVSPNSSTSIASSSPAPAATSAPFTSTAASTHINPSHTPTAVVMFNMGGPSTLDEVGPFLNRLFLDGEIITLGRFQNTLGPFIARRRTPRIQKQYAEIGGGSPIRRWTDTQGRMMAERLDRLSPHTAPHKPYTMFRYAQPLTSEALEAMAADGVTRAVAFSQYPQFSCTTSGSSLNHLWRELKGKGWERRFEWSVIDRWHTSPLFIAAVEERIRTALQRFPAAVRDKVVIVFSAHSIPMRVVNRGDPYTSEVATTVSLVMQALRRAGASDTSAPSVPNTHLLAWQSQVGYLPWMGPQTGEVIQGLAKQGHKHLLIVPIAFTSDHVETLYEIDREYGHVAAEAGVLQYERSESLNDSTLIADAMAAIVADHLASGRVCSEEYALNCAHCTNPMCRTILNPIAPYQKLRDRALAGGVLEEKNVVNEQDRRQPSA